MDKKYKENYKGKTISLVFNDSKQTDLYESWASQFRPELFNAVKAGIDGEDPTTVLRHSLECYGLSRHKEDELIGVLSYFMVEDQNKNFNLSHLKEALALPHFELPNFLKEDKKRIVGLAFGCMLLVAIPLWAVYYLMNKSESPKEIAQAEVASKVEPMTVPAAPSRFQDLVVGDGETSSVVNTSPTVKTEVEPTIDNQPAVAVEENETAPATVSTSAIEEIKSLILADDQKNLSELFAGSRIRIETCGYLTDYVSEDAYRLIQSGKINLVYDTHTPNKLKKIVIDKI